MNVPSTMTDPRTPLFFLSCPLMLSSVTSPAMDLRHMTSDLSPGHRAPHRSQHIRTTDHQLTTDYSSHPYVMNNLAIATNAFINTLDLGNHLQMPAYNCSAARSPPAHVFTSLSTCEARLPLDSCPCTTLYTSR